MNQYIVPDILSEKSENLQEISSAILEISRMAADTSTEMRRMTELDEVIRVLESEVEKMASEAQIITRLSEALYEIADLTRRTEIELANDIGDGYLQKKSYAKTATLNRIDPGSINIF